MTCILLTFLGTSFLYFLLLGVAICRVARHLDKQGPEVVAGVTRHVLLPLLGREKEEPEKKGQLPRDVSLN